MEVLLVVDDNEMKEKIQSVLQQAMPTANVACFTDPLLSVKYVNNKRVDWVFSNFQLKVIDGIQMLKMIHQLKPEIHEVLFEKEDLHKSDVMNCGFLYLNYPFTMKNVISLEESCKMQHF